MNMNKIAFNILTVPVLAVLAVSCGGQDEIYKEWVKKGGYDYPAKAINLSSVIGYQNVIVNWEKPMDPAVRTATLFWDNYAKSIDVDYADYPDGKVSIEVGELEDRSYTFDIVNYDDVGNKSLAAEITVSPYGDGWMVSRSERTVTSARMEGRDAKIVMSKATDEMVATRFRYKNLQDEWVESETVLKPGENEVTFKDAMKGKNMSWVELSSTSGYVIPSIALATEFGISDSEELGESGKFFNTVLFGGSHVNSIYNVLTGDADFCACDDTGAANNYNVIEGENGELGALYEIKSGLEAPLDKYAGVKLRCVSSLPVPAVPFVVNTDYVPEDMNKKVIDYMCSDAVSGNKELFKDPSDKDTVTKWKQTTGKVTFTPADDPYYDDFRKLIGEE